jgi:divalent metal cation (Fe/Co/Zn/Cd) transporter
VQEATITVLPDRFRDGQRIRQQQITRALWLVSLSVAFGLATGSVSVITGLHGHSLSLFAVGLGVMADVTGSATLVWRFRAERHRPGQSATLERRAAVIVAAALALVAVVLTVESASTLASGSHPGTSAITLIAAGVSSAVLAPLAYAKLQLGSRMASRALQGDGTLSGIGAATSLLALAALALNGALGWWWADRVAAAATGPSRQCFGPRGSGLVQVCC